MTPLKLFQGYKADKMYEKVHALFLRDKYKDAEKEALLLLKKYPKHSRTLLLVAQMARNETHFQKARDWYNKVVHFHPGNSKGILGRAKSSFQLYNFEDALVDYLQLYEGSFKNTDYIIALAECYQKINLQKLAVKYYKKAVNQSPKNIKALLGLGYQYIILGEYSQVGELVTTAREAYYENKSAYEKAVLENIQGLDKQLKELLKD